MSRSPISSPGDRPPAPIPQATVYKSKTGTADQLAVHDITSVALLKTIAVGVIILAVGAALGFWFWISIIVFELFSESNDDLANGRIVFAAGASVVLTYFTWSLARIAVE